MAKPHGIKHFSDYFKDHEKDYVIIGGSAAAVYLEDEGLNFRTTDDLDIVLLTNSSQAFNKKLSEYLEAGKYQTKEATENEPKYYRFSKPQEVEFPLIIEIFAKNENKLELNEGQYIIPVQNDDVAKISAILLDDEYFELLKTNAIKSEEGFSILNPLANICIKARAFRELNERNEEEKKIRKHRNDIVKLAQALKAGDNLKVSGTPLKDLISVLDEIEEKLLDEDIKKILGGGVLKKKEILDAIKAGFSL
jgi:hypothetical protein